MLFNDRYGSAEQRRAVSVQCVTRSTINQTAQRYAHDLVSQTPRSSVSGEPSEPDEWIIFYSDGADDHLLYRRSFICLYNVPLRQQYADQPISSVVTRKP